MKVYTLPPMQSRYPKGAEPLMTAQAMLTDLLEISGNRLGMQYAINSLHSDGYGDVAYKAIDEAIRTGLLEKRTTSISGHTYLRRGPRYEETLRAIWDPGPRVPFSEWVERHNAEKDRVVAEISEQVRRRDAGEPFSDAAKRCIEWKKHSPNPSVSKWFRYLGGDEEERTVPRQGILGQLPIIARDLWDWLGEANPSGDSNASREIKDQCRTIKLLNS